MQWRENLHGTHKTDPKQIHRKKTDTVQRVMHTSVFKEAEYFTIYFSDIKAKKIMLLLSFIYHQIKITFERM